MDTEIEQRVSSEGSKELPATDLESATPPPLVDEDQAGESEVWKPARQEWTILGCLTIISLIVVSFSKDYCSDLF